MEGIFFIVGGQRCGTTYLYHILDGHPRIEMAKPYFPEPKFFLSAEQYSKGKEWYLKQYFPAHLEGKILGEKSTSYLEHPEAVERMHFLFPQAKILVVLRNPVDRSISNYFFSKSNGIETRSLTEVFLENKPIELDSSLFSVSPINYVGRGHYKMYLEPYYSRFPKEQINVLIFEKLISDRQEIVKLQEFLCVESIPLNLDVPRNESLKAEEVDALVMESLRVHFRSHIDELEYYLNQDLSIWK